MSIVVTTVPAAHDPQEASILLMSTFRIALLVLVLMLPAAVQAQDLTEAIRLNQVGFYPDAPKQAVVRGASADTFYVVAPDGVDTLYTGTLSVAQPSPLSGETVRVADFSALRSQGRYVVTVPGLGYSYPFAVAPAVHADVARAALKGFYYQRASTALPAAYAGPWHRPAGHPDDQVVVHSSAATDARPTGTVIAAPKGWYDAGDYNKYIVNAGISTATLLSLYEDFPARARTFEVGIPERGGALPDVLDEALWNLRWMLAMQDPNDGGVYHKLTAARFSGMVMPHEANATRYVVQKSTAATLDFAAVMAQASRIFRSYENTLPGLSDSTLQAAVGAWGWARRHPNVLYHQDRMNEAHDPDIGTGAYSDRNVDDEFYWAAAELYAATQADSFYTIATRFADDRTPLPSWGQVRTLGDYTLSRLRAELTPAAKDDLPALTRRLIRAADTLVAAGEASAYQTPMGHDRRNYVWGSNAVAANQGIVLIQAYRLTGNVRYLDYALANLDYLLGRNATGYSFVTGYGDKTPLHPHHRPSAGDELAEPVPGLLVGGPNPGQQDECTYPSDLPARSYVDDVCSYASNEIAINWNAPLVYLTAALEALQDEAGYTERP